MPMIPLNGKTLTFLIVAALFVVIALVAFQWVILPFVILSTFVAIFTPGIFIAGACVLMAVIIGAGILIKLPMPWRFVVPAILVVIAYLFGTGVL